jgi:hypothetical protein
MKILWSRAAGLCSFPECHEILVRFSKTENGSYQIGEMAHLIARSLKGPRGSGSLATRAKNSYENHILLCPTCHAEIDKNPKDYPIEKLNTFKIQHEQWVAETLLTNIGERAGFFKFYSNLLNRIAEILQFDNWAWLIDHLWRDLAPCSAIDAAVAVRSIALRTIWPGTLPPVETAFKTVLQAWSDYCIHFETACQYNLDASFLVSSHVQPFMSPVERMEAGAAQHNWANKNGDLLYRYVLELNVMIDVVRKCLLPTYRQEEGYFLIHDDLGYRHGGESVIIRPYPKE